MMETNRGASEALLRLGLQFFAEGASGDAGSGGDGAEGVKSSDTSSADGGAELSHPSTEKEGGKQTVDLTAIKREHGLMSPQDAAKRYAKQSEKAGYFDKLTPALTAAAARYGVAPGDYEALAKAMTDDKTHVQEVARKYGIDDAAAQRIVDAEVRSAEFDRQAAETRQAEANARFEEEEAQVRNQYKDFDLGESLKNPKFKAMVDAGFSMQEAYEATHYKELTRLMIAEAVKEAEDKAATRMGAQGQRPREGASAGAAGEGVSLDYSKMTDEELYKAIAAASPYN